MAIGYTESAMNTDRDVDTLRQLIFEESGFDLFSSSHFIEGLVCNQCGLVQTDKQHSVDGYHPEFGFKVEIKMSALVEKYYAHSTRKRSYFYFCSLQGTNGKGRGADVFVFVGRTDQRLRFFVLPACVVGKRKQIEICIDPRIYQNMGKWLDYEVDYSALAEVVKRRGLVQIDNTTLF